MASVLAGDDRWCVIEGKNGPFLAEMPDKVVDHVLTDPPYSEHVHKVGVRSVTGNRLLKSGQVADGKAHLTTIGFDALTDYAFVPDLIRVARRWVLCFCALEQLGCYLEAAPKQYVRGGVFRKGNAAPQITGDRPGASCEGVAILHRTGKGVRKRWNGGGSHAFWDVARDRGEALHETPKPLELMVKLVELFTDPDDLVLDPYCGSGTTGAACLLLGRRFIGIEQNPVHVATSRERLTAIASGSTMAAARAGQLPMFGAGGC